MRTEKWCGYDIHFVEVRPGEWSAVLKDICDALNLKTYKVIQRIDCKCLEKVMINVTSIKGIPHVTSRARKNQRMFVINEEGIYQLLFASRKPEAAKFRQWSANVLKKLRTTVGLEGYEVLKMTEPETQEEIDAILDSLYYDDTNDKVMRSVTVQGGDVKQVEFVE